MPAGIPDGVTPNDPLDADGGGNGRQNFPLITTVTTGATTRIQGFLHTKASMVYDLDFYSNGCPDFPRQFAEGRIYIGSGQVTTDGNGDATFDVTLPVPTAAGDQIVATATDPAGSTSEFSQRLPFTIAPAFGTVDGRARTSRSRGTDFAPGATVTLGGQPLPEPRDRRREDHHRRDTRVPPGHRQRPRRRESRRHPRHSRQGVRQQLHRRHRGQVSPLCHDARRKRHHGGRRRRPVRRGPGNAAPADGGLPPEGETRPLLRAAPVHAESSPTFRVLRRSRPGSRLWRPRASRAAAARVRTVRSAPCGATRWRSFS